MTTLRHYLSTTWRYKMKPIFVRRPLSWIFRRSWYSTYRWTHPHELDGCMVYLIDIGMFTIGVEITLSQEMEV
jgi:hypothetical protein